MNQRSLNSETLGALLDAAHVATFGRNKPNLFVASCFTFYKTRGFLSVKQVVALQKIARDAGVSVKKPVEHVVDTRVHPRLRQIAKTLKD